MSDPQMLTESTALGLTATWWTAIATIVALVLGLWGVIGPWTVERIKRPKLELRFSDLAAQSEIIDDTYHLRVPVANAEGKSPATNVEVFLLSIVQEHVQDPIQLPTYLPIRMVWAHGGKPVSDRIAGGTQRLLDFGQLTFTVNSTTGFVEAVCARIDEDNSVLLGFNLEIIPRAGRIGLPVGSYTLKFLISSSETTARQSALITVRNRHLTDGENLGDYLNVDKA